MKINQDHKDWALFKSILLENRKLRGANFCENINDHFNRYEGNFFYIEKFIWDEQLKSNYIKKVEKFNKGSEIIKIDFVNFYDGEKFEFRKQTAHLTFSFSEK